MKGYPIVDTVRYMYDNILRRDSYYDGIRNNHSYKGENPLSYNLPAVLRVNGMSVEAVKERLNAVFEAHSVFCAVLEDRGEDLRFYHNGNVLPDIDVYVVGADGSAVPYDHDIQLGNFENLQYELDINYFKKRIRGFVPGKDSFVRCELHLTKKYIYIFLDMFHFISDGFSLKIINKDLKNSFGKGFVNKEKIGFFEFMNLRSLARKTDKYKSDKEYFDKLFSNIPMVLYPLSKKPDNTLPVYGNVRFSFSEESIKTKCLKLGISAETLFVYGFIKAISNKTGNNKFGIYSYGYGRDEPGTLSTVGCFHTFVPLFYNGQDIKYLHEYWVEEKKHSYIYDDYPEDIRSVKIAINYMVGYSEFLSGESFKLTDNLEYLGLFDPDVEYATIPIHFRVMYLDDKSFTIGICYNSSMYSHEDMCGLIEETKDCIKNTLKDVVT